MNYTLGSFMEPMLSELEWDRADYTLARTVGMGVMAAFGIYIGAGVDRYGPKPLMLCGTLVLGTAIYACSNVQTLWGWLLLNGVMLSAGAAMLGNLVVNVTLAKWFVEMRGSAVAWAAMGVSFAGILITPGITWVIDVVGWREAWRWLALFSVVVLIPVVLLMRRTPEDHGLHPDGHSDEHVASGMAQKASDDFSNSLTRAQALHTRTFYFLVTAFGFFSLGIGVMLLQTVPYLSEGGITRNTAAFMILVASVPAMLTKPVWGYFIDRMEAPRRLAAFSAALTGVAIAIIVWGQSTASLWLLYAGFITLGMGWGGMIPLQEVIWAGYFGRRHLGSIRGAAMPVALGLGAAGPWLSSWYHDQVGNYTGAISTVAALNLLSAALILAIPKLRRDAP